jgi:hypothetical protein
MLDTQTIDGLYALKLPAMATGLAEQREQAAYQGLSFEERLENDQASAALRPPLPTRSESADTRSESTEYSASCPARRGTAPPGFPPWGCQRSRAG